MVVVVVMEGLRPPAATTRPSKTSGSWTSTCHMLRKERVLLHIVWEYGGRRAFSPPVASSHA